MQPRLSVEVIVIVDLELLVGVPESKPALESVNPVGSVPPVTAKV